MNKKIIVTSLLAALLIPATNGFAQKVKMPKKLNSTALERSVNQSVERFVRVPGVYIPSYTTARVLEKKVALTAQKAHIKLAEGEARVIAQNPERLRQFQAQAGMPIFEGRPLPYKQGIKVLQANQEKFAQARANGEYEEAWENFQAEKKAKLAKYYEEGTNEEEFYAQGGDFFQQGKRYADQEAIAIDVYNFYVKHIGIENLPRVRMEGVPEFEAVVCEIPVDGLHYIAPRPMDTRVDVSPEKFVVIHSSNRTTVMYRGTLEDIYRVIK